MAFTKFAILITTKNRVRELNFTLESIAGLTGRSDVKCIVCDDGSDDGTSEMIAQKFPNVILLQHKVSKGYLYARNKLLSVAEADFAISLDDDAHFLSSNPLGEIEDLFNAEPSCGVVAFRIFWGTQTPADTASMDKIMQVQSFVGCGHAWRMSAWNAIPDYPEWFKFYGEEDFASYELFKRKMKVMYGATILIQHRVDQKMRRTNTDHNRRLARSLAAGWYLYFMFLPIALVPRKFIASIVAQFRSRIFNGNPEALKSVLIALGNLIVSAPKIIANENRLTRDEHRQYISLPPAKIYWFPDKVS